MENHKTIAKRKLLIKIMWGYTVNKRIMYPQINIVCKVEISACRFPFRSREQLNDVMLSGIIDISKIKNK